jgi:Protein of unknown function (DUF3105)
MWLFALIAAVVIAAGAVGIAMAFRGGSGAEANGVDGPCVRQTFPPQGRQHVQELGKNFTYNSFTPTSGPHYPVPAVYNIYDQPVPEIRLVHNLEHGAIVVQYGSKVPRSVIQQIADWYAKSPLGMIVAPLPTAQSDLHSTPTPGADKKIFVTAWTHLASCSTFDEDAFSRFRDDYRGPKGDNPEKYPLSELQPGGT